MIRYCPNCNDPIGGRSDKKYCSIYCKSSYQYKLKKEDDDNLFRKIDKQLNPNYALELKKHS